MQHQNLFPGIRVEYLRTRQGVTGTYEARVVRVSGRRVYVDNEHGYIFPTAIITVDDRPVRNVLNF